MATATLAATLNTPISELRPATVDRILVIEDDDALRKVLKRLFSSEGYQVDVVSDGTAKPYRVHMRNPGFATLQALETMCKGRLLADVVAVIGSIDIVLGEIDR